MKPSKTLIKCVVPACENYCGPATAKDFYSVPSTGHSSYAKWCRLFQLSGNRTERICSVHFKQTDFFVNCREKLRETAVPSVEGPVHCKKLKFGGICCVDGCFTKTRGSLMGFPTKKSVLNAWIKALGIEEGTTTNDLKICNLHFKHKDYRKVVSHYLKPNAVPSRKLVPKRVVKQEPPSEDHTYTNNKRINAKLPGKSNRMCCVPGCRTRATTGIKLHCFPAETEGRFWKWYDNLRLTRMPTKNSKVCSLHFDESCYLKGGQHLKKTSIPFVYAPEVMALPDEHAIILLSQKSETAGLQDDDDPLDDKNFILFTPKPTELEITETST
ncbi:uncharacterized protein LOC134215006 [Armigeres subalbatus]|uniref:uncharacterized protein LOC134215006 n=1 Tax=Armigeres subalbatus TaxID=124917 RepID=UPI002ED09DF8